MVHKKKFALNMKWIIVQNTNHHKLPISWNFNKIHAKLVNNMFVQNLWALKCKIDMKNK
jgi:hypothetical protein